MRQAKTERTPKLIKVAVWEGTHRVLAWRVMWDGQIIGLITRPLPNVWEWDGQRFSSRQAAVDAVLKARLHSLPVIAHGYGFDLP